MNRLSRPIKNEYFEKNSRFLALAYPCHSIDEFKGLRQACQEKYNSASHVTYALRLIVDDQVSARFSDDGEPSGTAGRPILNHLEGKDIINICLFVVRYFGGIKLGAGGLIRAYGQAAKLCLNADSIEPYEKIATLSIVTDYSYEKQLDYLLKKYRGLTIESDYGEKVRRTVQLAEKDLTHFLEALDLPEEAVDVLSSQGSGNRY